jgi:hypothetical protein
MDIVSRPKLFSEQMRVLLTVVKDLECVLWRLGPSTMVQVFAFP